MGRIALLKIEGKAKINLTLDILGKRPDGYHEVSMIMQSIALHDTLSLEKMREGIGLKINVPWMKADESNLVWKAAALVQERCGLKGGVNIRLTKRIPVAAGLAGGSADAAAVLRGMDRLYGLGLSDEELCALGAELGSDIPFCLMGGTMLSTGRGEVLRRLKGMPTAWVVLAKPRVSVSTAWAYQNYDEQGAERHPDNALVEQKIIAQDLKEMAPLLCNVLESVTIKKYEVIERYKQLMLEKGALMSMMSGSGPTVFGLTAKKSEALRIAGFLRHATRADVFVTRTSGSGTRFV
jgi:4-diphosphocytidyl-2-C-methyl-D-erythritol kinase